LFYIVKVYIKILKEKIMFNFFNLPFIIMGFTSILLQIAVLRLLLSTFSGNELDIGITLSFWLIYVGLGSFTGRKIKFKNAFAFSFILIAIFAQPTVLAIKAIRPALSLEPGEIVSLFYTILATSISLFPLCFVIGTQFPLAVSYAGQYDPIPGSIHSAGKVYGIEAIGSFIGGVLFTFIISSRMNAMELCLLISLINILLALYVSDKKIIALILIIPISFYLGLNKIATALPWHGLDVSETAESKYGEITVIKVREQSSIYSNGHLLFSYPDLPVEEMKAHLPMSLHISPSRILVIGGSPGTIKEFLKYPVTGIDFVELDPKIIKISLGLLNEEDKAAIKDPRVRIIIEDGRKFIKGLKDPTYDMIILNLPQPSTASINRFYTSDFFREAKKVLKENGILALSLPKSSGYIGRSMQTASGSIYNSLRSVFKHVEVTAQEYGGLFASDSPINTNPEILEQRFAKRGIITRHFNQYIFLDAFSPFGVDYVRKRLEVIKNINTDLRPSAYIYNLILWSEVHGGEVLKYMLNFKGWQVVSVLIITLMLISFFIFKRKKRVIYYSVFSTGFSGMSFVLIILLIYQSLYGYIYEMIGLLTATFMMGLWIGTLLTKNIRRPFTLLFYLELMTIILALISPLFFREEPLFYCLILLSGIITGGQFNTANLSIGELKLAGKLYGLDLIGSFLGAFIPSIIFIPLFGVWHTLLLIAVIKAVSALMILALLKAHFSVDNSGAI
jgi:spermidine synthase